MNTIMTHLIHRWKSSRNISSHKMRNIILEMALLLYKDNKNVLAFEI